MRIPKKYGQSKTDECPFCGKLATVKNPQGLIVCNVHKDKMLDDIKCPCGSYLDIRQGKFGAYFNCINCGNINLKKGLEMKDMQPGHYKVQKAPKKNVSDEGKYPGFDYGV